MSTSHPARTAPPTPCRGLNALVLLLMVAGTVTAGAGADPPLIAKTVIIGDETKLTASGGAGAIGFGYAVAISGDTAIVGSVSEAVTGAAYVFNRDQGGAGTWGEVKRLLASDGAAGDGFGRAVAISGDTAVVGAYGDDDQGSDSGAAYVFARNQGGPDNWGEAKRLTGAVLGTLYKFGWAVAISGDTVVVGAYGEQTNSGFAYIFERHQDGPDNWGLVRKITGADTDGNDGFGGFVAIDGDTIVSGAPGADFGGVNLGAAYVFERDQDGAGMWGQVKRLTASAYSTWDARYGGCVAISGDTIAVGSSGSQTAYIYDRDQGGGGNWGEVKLLSFAVAPEFFGWSVAVNGDVVMVGAYGDVHAGSHSGSAYVYERDHGGVGAWGEVEKLTASDAAIWGHFGLSLGVAGDIALIGGPSSDGGPGDAYVYRLFHTGISLPDPLSAAEGVVEVPVGFDGAVLTSGVAFSLDYDQTCLDFDPTDGDADGIPDAITVNVPADFEVSVFFDLGDSDGEIDVVISDYLSPIAALSDGPLVTVAFTTTCSPAQGTTVSAPVGFSTDPPVSFSDDLGQSLAGSSSDGSVLIYPGPRGDCNGDGTVTVADNVRTGLEIFDGDGDFWSDVPGGSLVGSPVGCDANAETVVDVADVLCVNRLIFGLTCGGTRVSYGGPGLFIDDMPPVSAGVLESVPVVLAASSDAIGGVAFSLDLDPARLSFDPTDSDGDGLPDAVSFPVGSPGMTWVEFDAADTGGELDLLLAELSGAALNSGVVLEIELLPQAAGHLSSGLRFSSAVQPSFGSVYGVSIPGRAELTLFVDGFESGDTGVWSRTVP